MEPTERFHTTSLPLAAALACLVPGAAFSHIEPTPSEDGRRQIVLEYPPTEKDHVQAVVSAYHDRCLAVPLYRFNRALNEIRDRLKRTVVKPGGSV